MQNTAGNKDDSVLPTFMVLRVFTLDPIICISSLYKLYKSNILLNAVAILR